MLVDEDGRRPLRLPGDGDATNFEREQALLADFLTKVLRAPEQERQTRRVLVNVEEVIAQVGVMPLRR